MSSLVCAVFSFLLGFVPFCFAASDTISKISSVELWAEGVEGDFHLEFDWVGAGPMEAPPPIASN